MPVEIQEFHRVLPGEVREQLHKVYVDMPASKDADNVIANIEQSLQTGARYYAGLFNGRWICGVLVSGDLQDRNMSYLAVHPATRGRGVAERLVNEVRALEGQRGSGYLSTEFDVTDADLVSIFEAIGFIAHEGGLYRCQL
ncbi:MAG: acetyl-CoA sensor PanZ family protein [Pseudomonadales bacterium]|nr:acetyl-CoA sensor PanZ family protein [Pseudomonadales bacterium]